jgi:hypothetical protein
MVVFLNRRDPAQGQRGRVDGGSKNSSPLGAIESIENNLAMVFRCRPLTGNGKIRPLCALRAFAVSP